MVGIVIRGGETTLSSTGRNLTTHLKRIEQNNFQEIKSVLLYRYMGEIEIKKSFQ